MEFEDVQFPSILYHYTSLSGFIGILESGHIWATKITYLNDRKEFKHAINLGISYLRHKQTSGFHPEVVKKEVSENLDMIQNMNVCVTSFTENGDLLSQWRAYSGNNTGVAIGFKPNSFKPFLNKHEFELRKCVYDKETQDKIIKEYFDNVFASIVDSERETVMEIIFGFTTIAASMKDPGFQEEREWRLISKPVLYLEKN